MGGETYLLLVGTLQPLEQVLLIHILSPLFPGRAFLYNVDPTRMLFKEYRY